MITELRLLTNSLRISERFWTAIYPSAGVERGVDRWGKPRLWITPETGPALEFGEAIAAHLITTVDLVVQTDPGAADRLRAAGFEVAHDGAQAVDVNATDATIKLEVRP
ncbi:Uncharacterised protein [Mycobacteroides abscessus subsp. abscessus]|uniref:hypothetical protein n=1 Tax=Mycobacteroides abscessus TaxID=36809 RepID=UPI0005E1F977|nr:hypothetical protein [Mycobacteroides abscessus]ANO17399.1 hypothetical protein BAB78_01360 [Mycobacteroides abscessus]MDB2220959.1 hypothetical protein [Mycobacteroides abscessus subsp. abscessus]OTR08851.1 hypothetical protein B9M85_01320 [Mycobacteroides abscessus]CPR89586.1 Uncharacterised protein [Mycobacteroides abscessus]SHS86537.1 Uncharacterised protein [Mycobacteroides abscessus subsp. abscessus]